MNQNTIFPHGNKLVNREDCEIQVQNIKEYVHSLPRLTLSQRNLADLECIATGVYSPLEGFVNEADYHNIVNHMRLSNGLAWSIPVTLQIPEAEAPKYQLDREIALAHPQGDILAVMNVTSKFKPDQDYEAQKVYLTTDEKHPGVKAMRTEGEVYLGGSIHQIKAIVSWLKYFGFWLVGLFFELRFPTTVNSNSWVSFSLTFFRAPTALKQSKIIKYKFTLNR